MADAVMCDRAHGPTDEQHVAPVAIAPEAPVAIAPEAPRGAEAAAGPSRECIVCLTEAANMLMRPCNHVCACQACSRRLIRHPCPLCRRMVTKVERVYF